MNPLCFSFDDSEYALLSCTLCWRPGCSNWTAAAEPVASADEASDVIDGAQLACDVAELGDLFTSLGDGFDA